MNIWRKNRKLKVTEETREIFCSKCGKENNDTAKFCAYCGAKLKSVLGTDAW